ncbi:MAG: ribonuclease catalytic domain-containing protein [Lautropia sp.]
MPTEHVLFEEAGQFKAGTILQDAGPSLQVETSSGKRTKVKQASVMLRFAAPGPSDLMRDAQRAADAIDPEFLWECAPQDEFDFLDLAAEYFGGNRTVGEAAGLLLKLHSLPVYFYRKGKGRYRPAQPETLRAALAAIERKRRQEAQIAELSAELVAGRLPDAIRECAVEALVAKDRQSVALRALDDACQATGMGPERLLLKVGAFASPRAIHEARFLRTHFPVGTGFPVAACEGFVPFSGLGQLPDAALEAFSVDDETTTEIDDCLSVTPQPDGLLRIGVHIAVPALAVALDDPIDRIARERMTTVYAPGEKITMLPEVVVRAFSLDEGGERPALSLYVDVEPQSMQIHSRFTRVDRVRVVSNLRHNQLDGLLDEAALEAGDPLPGVPHADAIRVLWRFMLARSAERDRMRGRPEARSRVDFSFYLVGAARDQVEIRRRRRDAPIDRIVAEMAILANAEWGRYLAEQRVAGLYRSQSVGKVKMGTHPLEHVGLGVAQYAWCTSPLRRYVDLVNQMQLLAALAGRAPPYAPNDASLFGIVSGFDARYGAVSDHQQKMERYWCLRWIAQQETRRFEAVAVREDTVRLEDAPLYFPIGGLPPLAAGQRLLVDILETDELNLTVQARPVQLLADVGGDPVSVGSEAIEEPGPQTGFDAAAGPPAVAGAAPGGNGG